MGLSLAEIREILELYDEKDGAAQQTAHSLKKFRERLVALEQQREDIEGAIEELRVACERLEDRLKQTRPDLLPRAADYDQMLRARLDGPVDTSSAKSA